MSDDDVGRFGRWAESYNRSLLQRLVFGPLQEFTLAEAFSKIPDPRSILDIGCGTGLLLRRAARRFPSAQLIGVDAAEKMIEVAQAAVPPEIPVRFAHAFAERLPFPDDSFDLVLTTMSFHHWADQSAALREVDRVLAPGGFFALTDAQPVGWLRWMFVRSGHGRFNKPSVLEAMIRGAGLAVDRRVAVPGFGGTVQVILAGAGSAAP